MNILIFVMAILMLLATMTYARLESFRSFTATQAEFQRYIEEYEREYTNSQAKVLYDEIVVNPKSQNGEKEEPKEQNKFSAKLNIRQLLNPSEGDQSLQVKIILSNLMSLIYSNQEFYKSIEEQTGPFLENLILAIDRASSELPEGKKIGKLKDIATLDLGDQLLNEAFYKMLKGSRNEYPSLLDLMTMDKNRVNGIRVYLAPEEILRAIFRPEAVEAIIATRRSFYNSIGEESNLVEMSNSFKLQFIGERLPNIEESYLDFTISKTYPGLYKLQK